MASPAQPEGARSHASPLEERALPVNATSPGSHGAGRAARARWLLVESSCRSTSLFEHDLFRKPVPAFRDHALELSPDFARGGSHDPPACARRDVGIGAAISSAVGAVAE